MKEKFEELLVKTSQIEIRNDLRNLSYAGVTKQENTTSSSIKLKTEVEKKRREKNQGQHACNIIVHGVEESINEEPIELKIEDQKYIENVIGVFTKERESKEQYRPLKICLESEEIKIQVLNNLTKLKGLFIKVTEDLTKQERLLVKKWQQKAQERNKKNKTNCINGVSGEAHGVGYT